MMPLTFITGNQAKADQLSRYLDFEVRHQKLDIPEIQSLDLEEVAIAKAREAYRQLGTPVLVEDTSLIFTALGTLPGPLVKWFYESLGNDGMTELLSGYPDRSAVAKVCFAFCDERAEDAPNREVKTFWAEKKGTIAKTTSGKMGFGWDPIFIPEGYTQTWGEMTNEMQDKTSVRKDALEKLQRYLVLRESSE